MCEGGRSCIHGYPQSLGEANQWWGGPVRLHPDQPAAASGHYLDLTHSNTATARIITKFETFHRIVR